MKLNKNIKLRLITSVILTFIFLVTFNSCHDLEEDLSGVVLVENIDAEEFLLAAVTPLYEYTKHVYSGAHCRITTYGGDDITTWIGGNKEPLRVFDRFEYENGKNSHHPWQFQHGWERWWKVIYYSNELLDGLKTSTAPEASVALVEGEARFFRAWSYYNLVRQYGGMPLIVDGMDIPELDKANIARSTVLETYEVIEADLVKAAELLPHPSLASRARLSNAAANTALASLYLTWGGWPVKDNSKYALAASSAKKVMDLGYFELLDIMELWKEENEFSKEAIFAVEFLNGLTWESSLPGAFSTHECGGFSDCFAEKQFYRDFPEGPRKDATFLSMIPVTTRIDGVLTDGNFRPWEQSQRGHPLYNKYRMSGNRTLHAKRLMGFRATEVLRYAEVLLIYAEAKLRVSANDASALEALNQVKRRAAGLDYLTPDASVDVTSATPNDVVDESGWELAGEYKRWFDLVRTERVEEMTAKRDPSEEVALVQQPNKDHYIAPIPNLAFINSEGLVQNPEGFKIK